MKKASLICSIVILIGAVGLVLFKVTGLTPHIIISVITLVAMLACMIVEKKNWKIPVVEVLYRVFYLIALISGFVVSSGSAAVAISVVHKIAAALFAVLFIVSSVIALKSDKKS